MNALALVESFDSGEDGLAGKSRDLTLALLRFTPSPFSRSQFTPGHITCTALVRHASHDAVLLIYHHRHHRWLLPGGHVEAADATLAAAAAREAAEETSVRIDATHPPVLAGIEVHAIPPKGDEPMHLHHDLIWAFRAGAEEICATDEAPRALWACPADWGRLELAEPIRRAIARVT